MIKTRNLIYHITPFQNDVWKRNVCQLLKRMHVFNGKKIIAIATDSSTAHYSEVERCFREHDVKFLHYENNQIFRETVSWYGLLDEVVSVDPEEATFYAHAKGVTRPDNAIITNWRNAMYHYLLDDMDVITKALDAYPCVGTHRQFHWPGTLRKARHLAQELRDQEWHYAGTFFWFRNKDLFSQPKWRQPGISGYLVEFYLSLFFKHSESFCAYLDNPPDPYKSQAEEHPDPPDWFLTLPDTVRVELGGGINPRPGFVNVDQIATAHVRLDLDRVGKGQMRLPFADDSVDYLYSSHCVEHLNYFQGVLWEIVRVCHPGAVVELRVPHHQQNQAHSLLAQHRGSLSYMDIRHLCYDFPGAWFNGQKKRLRQLATRYIPLVDPPNYQTAKRLFPHLNDEEIFRFIPDTCHESQYLMEVIPNEFCK